MNDRELGIRDTLGEAFSIYGSQAGTLLPVAFLIALLTSVVPAVAGADTILLLLTFLLGVVANTLYTGFVVELVHDVQDGRRDYSVGQLVRSATPFIWPLFAAGFLAAIGIGIGFILLIVPGLFLITIWAVISPAIVVERTGVFGSFGRSRQLVRGHGWRVFAVIVTVFLIGLVVWLLFLALAYGIDNSATSGIAADTISSTLTLPINALVAAVLYFKLRALHGDSAADSPATPEPSPSTV